MASPYPNGADPRESQEQYDRYMQLCAEHDRYLRDNPYKSPISFDEWYSGERVDRMDATALSVRFNDATTREHNRLVICKFKQMFDDLNKMVLTNPILRPKVPFNAFVLAFSVGMIAGILIE